METALVKTATATAANSEWGSERRKVPRTIHAPARTAIMSANARTACSMWRGGGMLPALFHIRRTTAPIQQAKDHGFWGIAPAPKDVLHTGAGGPAKRCKAGGGSASRPGNTALHLRPGSPHTWPNETPSQRVPVSQFIVDANRNPEQSTDGQHLCGHLA